MLKPNDRVRCIEPTTELSVGYIYIVSKVGSIGLSPPLVGLKGLFNGKVAFHMDRFELVEEPEQMTTNRKHHDVIIAYAKGATIEWRSKPTDSWVQIGCPTFHDNHEYRVRPSFEYINVYTSVAGDVHKTREEADLAAKCVTVRSLLEITRDAEGNVLTVGLVSE